MDYNFLFILFLLSYLILPSARFCLISSLFISEPIFVSHSWMFLFLLLNVDCRLERIVKRMNSLIFHCWLTVTIFNVLVGYCHLIYLFFCVKLIYTVKLLFVTAFTCCEKKLLLLFIFFTEQFFLKSLLTHSFPFGRRFVTTLLSNTFAVCCDRFTIELIALIMLTAHTIWIFFQYNK